MERIKNTAKCRGAREGERERERERENKREENLLFFGCMSKRNPVSLCCAVS